MSKILSGKVKKVSPTQVSADRYNFLQLSEAEPDLGVPVSSGYALTSATDGTRSWADLSSLYVSVSGDTINGDLVINGSINNVDSVQFDLTAAETVSTGELAWNAAEETLDLGLTNGTVLQVGQEVHYCVQNQSGSTITDGKLVVASGTLGNSGKIIIEEWDPAVYPPVTIMGLTTGGIDNGETGYVTHFGKVRGIQTNGANYGETWDDGDILYAGASGGLTNTMPQAPNTKTIVAIVVTAHPSNGTLFVRPTLSSSLGNNDSVELSSLSDNQLLYYNAATERFENTSVLETLTVDNVNIDGSNISGVGGTTIYLKNLGEPTTASDAATKNYVDTVAEGLTVRPAVKAATTTNLSATYDNGTAGVGATLNLGQSATLTIDGVATWELYDGVLVKDQTNAEQNGRYFVSQIGDGSTDWILERCTYCDEPNEIVSMYVFVQSGATNASTGWVAIITDTDSSGDIEVGVDDIEFIQFSGAGTYSAGVGLDLNGTVFSHEDTSAVTDLTSTSRTYVNALTFDTFGHVTGYTTGTETTVNVDTNYAISTEPGDDIYSEKIRLEGTDASSDDIIIAVGAVDTTYGLTIAETGDTITLAHADTSSVSNITSNNSNGIVIQDVSFTFDTYGHVTGATAATVDLDNRYDNYVSWTAEDGDGSTYTITSGDALTFAEGPGIDVNFTEDDVLTFTNTDLGSSQNIFKNVVITDTDSGYTWADTGSFAAVSNSDTITLVSGTNVEIDTDSASNAIRITATVSGVDNYVDSASFNTGTGVLTLGRTGALADLTVDLDGRYVTSDTNTTYSLDGSGTANNVNIELVGSDTTTDSINIIGTGEATVSWDEGNQRITINSTNADPGSGQFIFKNFEVTDTDSGYTWSGTGTLVADNNNDTIKFVSGTNVNVNIDPGSDAILISSTDTDTTYSIKAASQTGGASLDLDAGGSGSGTDSVTFVGAGGTTVTRVDADTIQISTSTADIDNYVDSVSFNTGTGVLTLGRTGVLADLTVDLDGRYDNYVSWTAEDGDGTTYAITSGDTLKFAEGSGIDVNFTADDVLTFTNTDLGSSQNIFKTFTITDTDSGYTWADTGSIVADSNSDTVTFVSGNVVDVDVDATSDAIRISHRDVSRSNTTSTQSPGYGGTFTVVDSVVTSAQGHITDVNVKTITLPSADDTDTTYVISTEAGADAYSEKIRLTGSNASTDDIILAVGQTGSTYGLTIAESGDTITFAHADTSTQASVNNSGTTYIQDITLDEFGHITNIGSAALPTYDNYVSWTARDDDGTTYTITSGDTLTFDEGAVIDVNFTADDVLTFSHKDVARTDTSSNDSPGYGGTFTVVDSVTTTLQGHISAVNLKTVTLPSADDTDNYVDSVSFNTGTGVLTLGRTGVLADLTVDLDGRYDNYSSWTAEDGDGTTYTVTSGDTLKFAEGSGIDVNFTADDVLTFTNTKPFDYFVLEDGDGTEVQVNNLNEIKFVEGTGTGATIDINWTDVTTGSDADPYDLTFTVTNTDRGSSQNIFKNFEVTDTDSGYSWSETGTVVADTNNDTVKFVSGNNIDIDVDATSDAIRISSTDTNTTYAISTEAGVDAYSEKIRLTASGSGSGTDDIILAVGQTGSTYGLTIAESGDTITFAHADTSSQSSVNNSGTTYIQDITLDEFGHITAIGSAALPTYDNYSSWTAQDADGTTYTVTSGDTLQFASGSGIVVNFTADDVLTFSHADTSSVSDLSVSSRRYVTGLTFDTFGHVTGYSTGTETVVDTNTTYSLDGSGTTNSVNIELIAGGSGSGTDSINVVGSGATSVAWDEGNQRITISSTDTNTDTNTTYSVKASTQTGGASLDLDAGGSGSGTDSVTFVGAGGTVVSRTDADTIEISSNAISDWLVKTSNYTAVNGDKILGDTSGGAFTVTLPAGPSTGDSVIIADGSDWSVNNLTIGRNGSTIAGSAANLILDIAGLRIELIYDGTTWDVISSAASATNITDDTTTNSNAYYPTLSTETSGGFSQAYVSSTKMYFNPSTGQLNATNFNSLSDVNKKININTIENALDKVSALRGVYFDWKEDGSKGTGVIAQEIEEILPEVVSTSENGEKSVSYGNVIGVLIEAIKELKSEIKDLKEKNGN